MNLNIKIIKNSEYNKYNIDASFFIQIVKNFFDKIKNLKNKDESTDILSAVCTKSFLNKTDINYINQVTAFNNSCYLKLEMNSSDKINISTEHVSDFGYDFIATLLKIKDNWLFDNIELKKSMKLSNISTLDKLYLNPDFFVYKDEQIWKTWITRTSTKIWDFVSSDYPSTDYLKSESYIADKLVLKYLQEEAHIVPDIQNDMYASHFFHYFFKTDQLKKMIKYFSGSYISYTIDDQKYFVKL